MKVERKTEEVEKTVVVTEEKTVVTLTLSEEEAVALAALCSRIQGWDGKNPEKNPRKAVTDSLYSELDDLGYTNKGDFVDLYLGYRSTVGSVYTLSDYSDSDW